MFNLCFRIFIVYILLLPAMGFSESLYTWTDENGIMHFSNAASQLGGNVEVVKMPERTSPKVMSEAESKIQNNTDTNAESETKDQDDTEIEAESEPTDQEISEVEPESESTDRDVSEVEPKSESMDENPPESDIKPKRYDPAKVDLQIKNCREAIAGLDKELEDLRIAHLKELNRLENWLKEAEKEAEKEHEDFLKRSEGKNSWEIIHEEYTKEEEVSHAKAAIDKENESYEIDKRRLENKRSGYLVALSWTLNVRASQQQNPE